MSTYAGENRRKKNNIIFWIIVIALLIFAINFYRHNNFNDFTRSEATLHLSEFRRDPKVKYSKHDSYRITSNTENDASFYKTISVKKDTPYKVTCMVKTENVSSTVKNSGIGAHIAIMGTTEKSISVSGTNDWQKIEMIFNSKNREEVKIGFRLGGYIGECTGTAWFSDFTIEEGTKTDSKEWNFACFIFENTDVTINGKEVKLSLTDTDYSDIMDTIQRFQGTCRELSNNKMRANCSVYKVTDPIKKLTYDDEFGYFVAPEDIENSIKQRVQTSNFDHIFVIIKLGDEQHEKDIQINDWIGLGAMDYYGIGYSNIRLPNSSKSYVYRYDSRINIFPEEVLLHEFLHSLERTAQEYGYEIPALHDNEKYGYKNQPLVGLEQWYRDYMNKNIKASDGKVGLPEEIFTLKPAKNIDFEYSYNLQEFKEPENIIEQIRQVFKNIGTNVKAISNKLKGN